MLALACDGQEAPASAAKPAQNAAADANQADAQPKPASTQLTSTPTPPDQRPDPAWFSASLLEGNVMQKSRSQADANGFFSSQILIETSGDVDGCANALTEKIKGHVPALKRDTGADGRITVSGTTDEYEVTLVCGKADDKVRAYISYRWTA